MARPPTPARRVALLAASLLAWGAGCGPPAPAALGAGAGLFDLLEAGQGARLVLPETNLTEDVGAALLAPRIVDGLHVPSDLWRDLGPADATIARMAAEHGITEELHTWATWFGPIRSGRFAAGDWPHLTLDGVPVERIEWGGLKRLATDAADLRPAAGDGPPVWADRSVPLMVWWNPALGDGRGALTAVSPRPPGDLQWRVRPDLTAEVLRWEPAGRGADAARPADLVTRLPWGVTTRRALVLPAPGSLSFPRRVLRADGLDLAVGVPDHAFAVDRGRRAGATA